MALEVSAATWLLGGTLILYLVGALVGFLPGQTASDDGGRSATRRRAAVRVSHTLSLLAAVTGLAAAAAVLLPPGRELTLGLSLQLPYSSNRLRLDALSAFFLLIISAGSLSASLYAPSYLRSYESRRPTGWLASACNLFVLAMVVVVTAGDAVLFLVAWEVMSVASYLLVMTEHEDPAVRGAGFLYVVMTHAGTAFITAGFLILMRTAGASDWGSLSSAAGAIRPGLRDLAFVFLLVGFGTKAGLIPLHIWLPRAHPAAPSHVSALMSGVMVKTAVYGLLRLVFLVLGRGPGWWGLLLMGLGLSSAVLGVLYALMESDLKRLLAFSTIENVGIILTGLGAALFARSLGLGPLASALVAASLLHALNHALFKGLLFQAVGAVHHATHTRNLEELGGLIHRMPQTALLFLGGAAAISALPPTNGFLSEVLTLKGLIHLGSSAPLPAARLAALLAATGLAFAGALAAAAFVKAFGISFLGLPRSERAASAREAPFGMRLGMWLLLALCLVIGLVPGPAMGLAGSVGDAVAGGMAVATSDTGMGHSAGATGTPFMGSLASLTPVLTVALLLTAAVAWWLARVWSGGRPVRVAEPWACGVDLQPEMQYSGVALVKPLRLFFRTLLRPERSVTREDAGSAYFPTLVRYEASLSPVYERYLYVPLRRGLLAASWQLKRLQTGSVQAYLAYIVAALALLLALAR